VRWLAVVLTWGILGCGASTGAGPAPPGKPPAATAPAARAEPAASLVTTSLQPLPTELLLAGPEVPGGGLDPMTLEQAHSASIGSPVEGWLQGGVALPLHGKGYVFNRHRDPQRRHGTVEMVQALIRAAAAVDQLLPGATLTINDLSLPGGGTIGGHASHRSGRDVDVLFYLRDHRGQPFPAKAIPIEPDGTGVDYRNLAVSADDLPVRLDVPRTWAFVAALLSDPTVQINRIYVVEHVRSSLLAHGEAIDAPTTVVHRFGQVTCQPKFPHDEHFHIRFYCAAEDIAAGCEDTFPIYPWHEAYLEARGQGIRLAQRRSKARPKLTSVAEAEKRARKKYGPLHPHVTDFLERRKGWVSKPHPGRPYCP